MPGHGVRFHNAPGGGAMGGEGAAETVMVAPELSLSTLEYYLFIFAWVRARSSTAAVSFRWSVARGSVPQL